MEWNPTEKYERLVALARDLLGQERRTVRDVYYALESRGYDYTYRQVRRAVKKGRLVGMIDPWRVIDTSRSPGNTVDEGFESPDDFLEEVVEGIEGRYFRNFWREQEEYVEVWLEKAGLSTVFAPICADWNVRLELLRGDWSTTKCYEAAARLHEKLDGGQDVTVLYFGDYNPSGFHAPVAVQNTMQEFGIGLERERAKCDSPLYFEISPYGRISYENGGSLKFERIAMTTDQVERFDLPENPAPSSSDKDRKIKGSFIAHVSERDRDIELNALKEFERAYLEDLIEGSIEEHADLEVRERVEERTEAERGRLRSRISVDGPG